MAHEMIFLNDLELTSRFDDEEEAEEVEEGDAAIDDELLGELDDDALVDDELLTELDPLLKADETGFGELEENETEKDGHIIEDDEKDEEVDDYDSFDDRDEM